MTNMIEFFWFIETEDASNVDWDLLTKDFGNDDIGFLQDDFYKRSTTEQVAWACRILRFDENAPFYTSDETRMLINFLSDIKAQCESQETYWDLTDEHKAEFEKLVHTHHAESVKLVRERWNAVEQMKFALSDAVKQIEILTKQRDKAEAAHTKPTALYRQFNASGDLLYIGIALDPFKRLLQHHRGSVWTSEQMTMTTEWHPSRPAALRAEKAAIIDEKPEWNVIHNQEKAA